MPGVSKACRIPANGGIWSKALFSTFQVIYSGCCMVAAQIEKCAVSRRGRSLPCARRRASSTSYHCRLRVSKELFALALVRRLLASSLHTSSGIARSDGVLEADSRLCCFCESSSLEFMAVGSYRDLHRYSMILGRLRRSGRADRRIRGSA